MNVQDLSLTLSSSPLFFEKTGGCLDAALSRVNYNQLCARSLSIHLCILLLILAVVISPILYSGYHDLHSAQTALAEKKYDDAARLFESAATHLVWRGDLWEQAGLAAYRSGNNAEVHSPAGDRAR